MIKKAEDIRQGKKAREEKRLRSCNVQFSDLISTQFEKEGGNADEGNGLQDSRASEETGSSG